MRSSENALNVLGVVWKGVGGAETLALNGTLASFDTNSCGSGIRPCSELGSCRVGLLVAHREEQSMVPHLRILGKKIMKN